MEIESDCQSYLPVYKPTLSKQKSTLDKICKVKSIAKDRMDNFLNPVKKIRKLSNSSMTTQSSSLDEFSQLTQMSYILADFKEIALASYPQDFLSKHKILPPYYSKMIDWLTQINQVFSSPAQTLFLSINLLQRYFEKAQKIQTSKDLHLNGIVCWYIASKFEDIYPLDIAAAREKLANFEFSLEEIQEKEIEILEVLDYELMHPNVFNYCCAVMQELNLEEELGQKVTGLVDNAIALVALMSQCDYKIVRQNQMNDLISAIIYTSIKIIAMKVSLSDSYIHKIMETVNLLTGSQNKTTCLVEIQLLAKNFTSLHTGMNYIEKFGSTFIQELKQMKKIELKESL